MSSDLFEKDKWLLIETEFDSIKEASSKSNQEIRPSSLVSTIEFIIHGGTRRGIFEATGLGVFPATSWNPKTMKTASGTMSTFSGNDQATFIYRAPNKATGMPEGAVFSSLLLTTTPEDCDCKSKVCEGAEFVWKLFRDWWTRSERYVYY